MLPLEASCATLYLPAFSVSDEFISLLLEQSSYQLLSIMDKPKGANDEDLRRELLSFAQEETAYRKTHDYPSLPSTRRHNEDLVYHRDTLRDYVDSVLHLSARDKAEGVVIRELILSMAAGVAMIFATAIAFLAHARFENWTSKPCTRSGDRLAGRSMTAC